MYAWQFVKAQATARRAGGAQFISMQNHYNLIYREEEREMIPACRSFGVGVLPWSPLARGILAGNAVERAGEKSMRARFDNFPDGRYEHPSDAAIIAALSDIAARRGVPQARVALAWLLHQPGVTAPIFGATKVSHVDDAVSALSFELSADELLALEAPYGPHDIHGHE
jgi:aryl-alcohol dehydrogenase (NADP+)